MPFIGNKPSAVPLTSADIADGIITSAKILDGTIVNSDISTTSAITLNKLSGNPSFRNIVINGDMQFAQRNTSKASITTSDYHSLDRYQTVISSLGTWTQSQSTDVPSGYGFAKSLKMDCTTADASPSAGDFLYIRQMFEGQNLQYLKKGTVNAVSLTASFWVKSTKTGTFIVQLYDNDNNRSVSGTYTVSVTNTWEFKTITFPADATGAFDNDNADSFQLRFWLGAGTNFTSGTLATTWGTYTAANVAVGQVNIADSTSNDFFITGVQLEAGTSATDFEFLPIDVSLGRCRRYFETNYNIGTTPSNSAYYTSLDFYSSLTAFSTTAARVTIFFKNTKRVQPTVTFYNVTGLGGGTTSGKWQLYDGSWTECTGATTVGESSTGVLNVQLADSYTMGYSNLVSGGFTADAEL
jgi:hypothetical protein